MPSHSNDRVHDDDNFRAGDDGARKSSNKVELPESKSVDLASVQFPRRGEFSLPDAPTLSAVHMNRRQEATSEIDARNSNGLELPEGQMDVANIATRKRDDLGLGNMPKPESAMQGIL